MTQEDKDLLLKDLCARLSYKVIVQSTFYCCDGTIWKHENETLTPKLLNHPINRYKPYLFPLSNMTEAQKKEINKRYINSIDDYSISIRHHSDGCWDDDTEAGFSDYLWIIDWFNKNHFDYRGLIPKGLAIDATRLNIY